jgi:PAS domain S-box-containing protein
MAKSRSGKMLASKKGDSMSAKKKKTKKKVSTARQITDPPTTKQTDSSLSVPSARIGVWQFNSAHDKIKWSDNCATFFGLKDIRQLPPNVDELIATLHKEDRKKFRELFRKSVSSKAELLIEVRVMSGNSYRWVEFSASPLSGESKSALIFGGVIQDVTIKKLNEFELHDWKTRNELVSESAGLLIYDYDIATGEIIWSGNTVQLVGFTSFEMGRIELWEQLIHPEDRQEAYRLLEKSRDELKPYNVYYRFRCKNKGYCYMHDRGLFVTNSDGVAVRMLGIMNDVSERVSAERTIKQSEKSYRELFNSVGEAIYIQKIDGTFVDVNQGACDMYGYTKEELIGKTPGFLAAPNKNNFPELLTMMSKTLHGDPQIFKWWGKKKSGEIFIMEVKLTRGTYFGDNIIIATGWDITDKIVAEQVLQESEKRFRRLIEDLNVGVILQGPKGEVQMANRTSLCQLGVSEEYLFNTGLHDKSWNLVTEDDKVLSTNKQPWIIASKTKKAVRGMVLGVEKPGLSTKTWLLVNAEPTLLDHEKLLHIVITLTDITERRQVEEELKESELRFRTLQEASFGGIGLHNKGMIIDCNQGLCDITGYSYKELIGSNGLNLIAPEYRDEVMQKILSKTEQPYDVEGIRKDGSRYYLEIHGKNIPYQEGLIRVTEFRDITDRKAAESKILEQNRKLISITDDLKLKNEQLQEFTQIVSHNLRSPVGNILSLLNFTENAESEEERREYVALLKEAGSSTLTTLHELNDVLQIKQNKNIEKQKLDFEQVFGNVRKMLVAKIVEVNAEVFTDFSEAPTIEYPNIYLESILLNLLSNALKYIHKERKPVITIKTALKDQVISLTITDNGAGLNMQRYGHHLFKLRKTFHKHPESRGIGLFMIKNQIEAMGGDITMSSVENEGTTFLVNFNSKIQEDEY